MALDSQLPEVRLALGLYHLWLERDPERALEEIARAEEGLPNDQSVYEARGAVYELLGRYGDAIGEYRKALNLSPNDPSILTLMSWDYWTLRQYQAAESFSQQAINLAPDQMWPNLMNVLTVWSDRGPGPGTLETLQSLPLSLDWVLWCRFWQPMWEDQPEEALAVLAEADLDWVLTKMWARPRSLLEAFAYRAMGRTQDAVRSFEDARAILENQVETHPYDPRFFSSLALSYAGLDRPEEALDAGAKAVALLPVREDAYYGLTFLWDLTAVHAMTGEVEQAVQGLENLLTVPSWMSGPWLNGDFRLDPIRGDPRFHALLERYADGTGI
jgi:tetratricopeptide (TPR) repeat protein